MAKRQATGTTSGEAKRKKAADLAVTLARTYPEPAELGRSVQRLVTEEHRQRFERILNWLASVVKVSLGLASDNEARDRLVTGQIKLGLMRHAFALYAIKRCSGRHAAALRGHTLGTGKRTAPEDSGEASHAERVARLFHTALPSGRVLSQADQVLLEGVPKPEPEDRPMTKRGLVNSANNFFAGVERFRKANNPGQAQCYDEHFRDQMAVFFDALDKHGVLTCAKRRKHDLTQADIQKLLNGLWEVHLPPIERLSMGVAITMCIITGLRPGELFRTTRPEAATVTPGERSSPFTWKRVELTFAGHREEPSGPRGTGPTIVEPFFMLKIEWEGGKNRDLGEIIPTFATSQPVAKSAYCVIRWLLGLALELGVFEDSVDKRIRAVIFGGQRHAMQPQTRLKIKADWLDVPVLLADRTRQWTGLDHHERGGALHFVALPYMDATSTLQAIADVLGWDTLHWYDFRRTLATRLKGKVDDRVLQILMGHHRSDSHLAYVSQHVPLDQAGIASDEIVHSAFAMKHGSRSHNTTAPSASTERLRNPAVAIHVRRVAELRRKVQADALLSTRFSTWAVEVISRDSDEAFRGLTEEQKSLASALEEAEADFLEAYFFVGGARLAANSDDLVAGPAMAADDIGEDDVPDTEDSEAMASFLGASQASDAVARQWLDELVQSGVSPMANQTVAGSLRFLGQYVAVQQTEALGFCSLCVARRPTEEAEHRFLSAGYEDCMALCGSQGLAYGHLATAQMQEVLYQYHRTREVPFMAMDKLQLRKVCARPTALDPSPPSKEAIMALSHADLIALAYRRYDRACCPNGILNDGSRWELPANVSPASSSTAKPRPALSLPSWWSLPDGGSGETSKYEAWRMALRAGVDLSKIRYLETGVEQLLGLVRKAMQRPGWSPTAIPPIDRTPLAETPTDGTVKGVAPLRESYDSLSPEAQGYVGIGRLGPLRRFRLDRDFPNRGIQFMHSVEHQAVVTPGMNFCWTCQTWVSAVDDPDHQGLCFKTHLADKKHPLTLDDFTVNVRPPASLRSTAIPFYLPIGQGGSDIVKTPAEWTSRLLTFIAKEVRVKDTGRNQTRRYLVGKARYRCVVPKCGHDSASLTAYLYHLASIHRFPVLRRGSDYLFDSKGPTPSEYKSKTADVRLATPHPPMVETSPAMVSGPSTSRK